jgi:hypothetical protein
MDLADLSIEHKPTMREWERDFKSLISRAKKGALDTDEEYELAEVSEKLWNKVKRMIA